MATVQTFGGFTDFDCLGSLLVVGVFIAAMMILGKMLDSAKHQLFGFRLALTQRHIGLVINMLVLGPFLLALAVFVLAVSLAPALHGSLVVQITAHVMQMYVDAPAFLLESV